MNLEIFFRGRINRATFLVGVLGLGILIGIARVISLYVLTLLLGVIFLFLAFSLWIRRLHDVGMSGWWAILILVPVVNLFLLGYLLFKAGDDQKNRFGNKPTSVIF